MKVGAIGGLEYMVGEVSPAGVMEALVGGGGDAQTITIECTRMMRQRQSLC
jgi:hypothetical protein